MKHLPTSAGAFLFTEIEGSTRLAQAQPDHWESLRERHHAILQAATGAHNGYVFQIKCEHRRTPRFECKGMRSLDQ